MQEFFDALSTATQTNFENSIATQFATALLGAGYLLYWHKADGLQTSDGYYPAYRANQATYLLDVAVQAQIRAARGLMTLVDRPSALPRAATRPTTGGSVGPQQDVPIPAAAVQVGEIINGDAYELGTMRRFRSRILTINVLCRDASEQALFNDLFIQTFDDQSTVAVVDHDGGTLGDVGSADVLKASVMPSFNPGGADAETYEVLFQAQLQFVA